MRPNSIVALANGQYFSNGREAAAWIGLTPKQYSSGGVVRLGGIGHTGQSSLRSTLIRGAWAVIKTLGDKQDSLSQWVRQLISRVGKHKAAVALANKMVRIAWAMLRSGETYLPRLVQS